MIRAGFGASVTRIGELQIPDPGIGAEPQQVAVAGNDKARAGGHGAFKHAVVIRVGINDIEPLPRLDTHGAARKQRDRVPDLLVEPGEFCPQDPAELLQKSIGDRQPEPAGFGSLEQPSGQAGKNQPGNVDVGVGGDLDPPGGLGAVPGACGAAAISKLRAAGRNQSSGAPAASVSACAEDAIRSGRTGLITMLVRGFAAGMASPVGPVGECAVLLLKVLDARFTWASSRSSWVCYCRYSLDGARGGGLSSPGFSRGKRGNARSR